MNASLSYDVVCAGAVTLDVTLAGLAELPRLGEERFGTELVFSPGAFATIAIGTARLGLRTALVSPRPRDLAGEHVASIVERDGVDWLGSDAERAAVTVSFPLADERAMASYDPGGEHDPSLLRQVRGHAFVVGPGDVSYLPPGASAYVMTGSLADRPWLQGPPAARSTVSALFANETEAMRLVGAATAADAALELGRAVQTAVITRGAAGAVACEGGKLVEAPAPAAEAKDTTGAGDLFAAAYVWADRMSLPLEERLRWAGLYASLSVGAVGAVPGAATLAELLDAGRREGLRRPV